RAAAQLTRAGEVEELVGEAAQPPDLSAHLLAHRTLLAPGAERVHADRERVERVAQLVREGGAGPPERREPLGVDEGVARLFELARALLNPVFERVGQLREGAAQLADLVNPVPTVDARLSGSRAGDVASEVQH